jgi:hypothetical protein
MLEVLLRTLPDGPEKEAYLYSTCKILYVELELFTKGKANKYLVLLDEKEPPLFFLINSERYGLNNQCFLPLKKEDYPFLRKEISYLNYMKVVESFDFVSEDKYPTKQQLLDILSQAPERVKGVLNIKDAEELLEGIQNYSTDLEQQHKDRIIPALKSYTKK